MSMQARRCRRVPEATAQVARAAFPKGSLPMTIRDQLGEVFTDTEFAEALALIASSEFGNRVTRGDGPEVLQPVDRPFDVWIRLARKE
ncbi:hypothetical protein HD597_000684 [Nonomuraea thailandensis]|uniref:Uncharacterized protein n=1 Tax=Nonomuraea thailandensis TaxID=1188745 RepID=A0A9X2JZ01_9ACTN|nr:hypothetical protein [Nonomuraea thailandensis]MCP2353664.1 hypothetical protein [Nonomuraea thailandensis]